MPLPTPLALSGRALSGRALSGRALSGRALSGRALPVLAAAGLVAAALVGSGVPGASAAVRAGGGPVPVLRSSARPAGGQQATPAVRRAPTPSPTPSPSPGPGSGWWRPVVGTSWQWQLSGRLDTSINAAVYDIDLFDTTAATVAALHAAGRHVICYLDVGTSETSRPDNPTIPASVQGNPNGWPGEHWLDIRRIDILGPIMTRRFDQCKAKGFDAVEPDNIDGYTNDTGFPLTATDQLTYNRYIANLAHTRGLGIALKNDLDQIPQLVTTYDFAIDEQCFQYTECAQLQPFTDNGKAILETEYHLAPSAFCAQARSLRISAMAKNLNLDAWRAAC